jgi:hypothetical protein
MVPGKFGKIIESNTNLMKDYKKINRIKVRWILAYIFTIINNIKEN